MPGAVVAGHVCMDLLPALSAPPSVLPGVLVEVGALRLVPGGCVAGTGLALADLGVPTRLVADVGDDVLGDVLVSSLRRPGLCTEGIVRRPASTTSYSIVVEPSGRDRAFWHHVGANDAFDGRDVDLHGADLLHLGYPSLLPALCADSGAHWEALLRRALALDVTTSLDLATLDPGSPAAALDWSALLTRVLPLTDVVTPSTEDVMGVLGVPRPGTPEEVLQAGRRLLELGAAVAMLTAGSAGLLLVTGTAERLACGGRLLRRSAEAWADRVVWVPAVDVPLSTTTGAGDAASAGLIWALLAGAPPEAAALTAARTAAARVAGRPLTDTAGLDPRATVAPEGWEPAGGGLLLGPGDATTLTRQESRC